MTADTESDALVRSLGALVVATGQIELRVPLLAGALLGIERQRVGIYLFGRQNTSRGLDVIAGALKALPDCEAREQATSWSSRVRSAYSKRSEIIHGTFGRDAEGRLAKVALARGLTGPSTMVTSVDTSAIDTVSAELHDLAHEFDQELCSILIRGLPNSRAMLGHPPI